MTRNTWKLQGRSNINTTEWDVFLNQDGTLVKYESRDLGFKRGRPMAGQTPMRYYARGSNLDLWFSTLKALYATNP